MKKVAASFAILLCCICMRILSEGNASLLEKDDKPIDRTNGLKVLYSHSARIAESQAFLKQLMNKKGQEFIPDEKEATENLQNEVTVPIQNASANVEAPVNEGKKPEVPEVVGEINVPVMAAGIPADQPQEDEFIVVNGEVNAQVVEGTAQIVEGESSSSNAMRGSHPSLVDPLPSDNDPVPLNWNAKVLTPSFRQDLSIQDFQSIYTAPKTYNLPAFSPGKSMEIMVIPAKDNGAVINNKGSSEPIAQLFKSISMNNMRHNDVIPGNVLFIRAIPQVRDDDNDDRSALKVFFINLSLLFMII